MATIYSFTDLSGAFVHPLAGSFKFSGKIGIGQLTVEMATERTAHDTAADGAVMVSYVPGDSGHVTIECQQTSDVHKFLLSWFNLSKIQSDLGNPSNWASAALSIRNVSDGTSHICTGVSPSKPGPKGYAAQGQKITWMLMCADIQNITA